MAELIRVKKVWSASIKWNPGPMLVHASDGPFAPDKMEIVDYGDRAKVEVSGRRRAGPNPNERRSKAFRLYGYPQYDPPPDWLIELVNKIGYWSVESGSMS